MLDNRINTRIQTKTVVYWHCREVVLCVSFCLHMLMLCLPEVRTGGAVRNINKMDGLATSE